ncbi:uncharacterized protein LOC111709454 [Eurytemora carolleeae]|uniref:uncharacterized protein LOC111709454 n=1 Tax=Eurytemora carolleeae TaxID=1294199 RepID=UPI000C79528A|nr:uncharacterized protein LOC111709454 [Eurytemora carolleeae]|eukprot:XP_023338886.1 uncharacterized protein LOC111709454 [Eurytemora affinis]
MTSTVNTQRISALLFLVFSFLDVIICNEETVAQIGPEHMVDDRGNYIPFGFWFRGNPLFPESGPNPKKSLSSGRSIRAIPGSFDEMLQVNSPLDQADQGWNKGGDQVDQRVAWNKSSDQVDQRVAWNKAIKQQMVISSMIRLFLVLYKGLQKV